MFLFQVLFLVSFSAHSTPLAPHLTDEALQTVRKIRDLETGARPRENSEMRYQQLVQKQTLSDLLEFYLAENQEKIETTYASFTPENQHGGGDDLGFGLHVVKRLRRKLPDGTEKVTDINELWPEDKNSSGLLLPDEIRIKTLSFEGKRKIPGSHELYLFDSIRVAWGPGNVDNVIGRRTIYSKSGRKQMRVPVSAPYSCQGCHDPNSGFSEAFLLPGEVQNPEAIVQDSQFRLPPGKQRGFQQYITYLKHRGKSKAFVEKVEQSLKQVRRATEVRGILELLQSTVRRNEYNWLNEDLGIFPGWDIKQLLGRQGYYQLSDGSVYADVIEDLIEGKYRWWEPSVAIP